MINVYGIPNCDTVRKARKWLEQHEIEYAFIDLREQGVDAGTVDNWLDELGWEAVVNRRSTTWKQLDPAVREGMDRASAKAALMEHPTLVKRPVLDTGSELQLGFSPEKYRDIFKKHTL